MAFFDCHFFSDTLGLTVAAYVLLPQASTRQIGMQGGAALGRFPTLYLLHGLSDDHTIWMRRTAIERYAAAHNLAVVMPAVGRSFYQDTVGGGAYWSYLSEELPRLCESWFPLRQDRAGRFAAGLSMGGYGALRLALGCPERYAAAASLSGALDVERRCREAGREGSRLSRAEMEMIFGRELQVRGTRSDLFHLARAAAPSGAGRPALYLACGTEDPLLPDSRAFHRHLDELCWKHEHRESGGGHDWAYWDCAIQHVLDWLPLTADPAAPQAAR